MKKQITNISILQSSKVLAIVGALVSAVYAVPIGLITLFTHEKEVGVFLLLQPLFHLILGFIAAAISFFIYNKVTAYIGGIELNTEDL